eukprot:Opistho-1_new@63789
MDKPYKSSHKKKDSWEGVGRWYDQVVGKEGHYYHKEVILPATLRLLDLSLAQKDSGASLLDLACGQGILARSLPPSVVYVGIDLSPTLIAAAKKHTGKKNCQFLVGDVTTPLSLEEKSFTHCTCLLALQNIQEPFKLFQNAYHALQEGGSFLLVLNHPCFRIPRQSSWQIDPQKKLQYRRVDSYLSPLKIPIFTHPSQEHSPYTHSYHYPLSLYSKWLCQAGFTIELLEEWTSNKKSSGSAARMENRSREEFPLFLAIKALKKS